MVEETYVINNKEEIIAFMGQWSAGTAFKNLFATCKIQIQKCLIRHIETPLVVNVWTCPLNSKMSPIFFGLTILKVEGHLWSFEL